MAITLLPEKGKGQVMAVCLLIIALILIYFVCLHWFFSGHLRVAREIKELQQSELRFSQEAGKTPKLTARLAEIQAFEANNVYFLPEGTFDLAAANLSTKLKSVLSTKAQDQTRCQVLSTQPQKLNNQDPYERVSVQVRLRCDLEDLVRILYELENATPLLFVDELNLYPQPVMDASMVVAGGNMDARFDLSGFIRPGAAPPAAANVEAPAGVIDAAGNGAKP
jgi:general secretion pathway protein M